MTRYQLIIWDPKRKAIIVPKTKNGPNGIALFILYFFFCKINNIIPMIAPVQNAARMAVTPLAIPSSHPIPNASFASANPIHRPRETIKRKAKKAKRTTPDIICQLEKNAPIFPLVSA